MVLGKIKGVLTWAVDHYLGQFVEDINTEALKMDLWRGHVELTDLIMRQDVLQTAGLPLNVAGTIAKVGISVSRSGAVQLVVDGARVTVTPLLGDEARSVRLRGAKAAEVRRLMAASLASVAAPAQPQPPQQLQEHIGLSQRIFAAMLEKIELSMTDVRVCYDHGPAMGAQLCVVVQLQSVTVGDAVKQDGSVRANAEAHDSAHQKMLAISGLSLRVLPGDDTPASTDAEMVSVPSMSVELAVGSKSALYLARISVQHIEACVRQWQLRELYLLSQQWQNAAQRATSAAAQYVVVAPADAATKSRFMKLHLQFAAGSIGPADTSALQTLEENLSAIDIAAFRIEAEKSLHTAEGKRSGEGWFAWFNRVAKGAETLPEPEPEPELQNCGAAINVEPGPVAPTSVPGNVAAMAGQRWEIVWDLNTACISVSTDGGVSERAFQAKLLGKIFVGRLAGSIAKSLDVQQPTQTADIRLDSLHVVDHHTANTRFPLVLSSQCRLDDGFVEIKYSSCVTTQSVAEDCAPVDSRRSHVQVRVGPFRAVYNQQFVGECGELLDATTLGTERSASARTRDRSATMMTGMSNPTALDVRPVSTETLEPASLTDPSASPAFVDARTHYRKSWTALAQMETASLEWDIVLRGPVVMLPESFCDSRCSLLVVRADNCTYSSAQQRTEAKGDEHPVKLRLNAWASRLNSVDAPKESCCLEPEMPYVTTKFHLHGAVVQTATFSETGHATCADTVTLKWDGAVPTGVELLTQVNCELYIMRRHCPKIVPLDTIPRLLFIISFPSQVHVQITEEAFLDLMGTFHGFSYSAFAMARERRYLELLRPAPGGPDDTCVYQVLLDVDNLLVDASVKDDTTLQSQQLVRMMVENVGMRMSVEREGKFTVAMSAQGLAAQDLFTLKKGDTYLLWIKKLQAHSRREPVELHFSSHVPRRGNGVTQLTYLDINNPAKIAWSPETVQRLMKFVNRGLDRLTKRQELSTAPPLADRVDQHSDLSECDSAPYSGSPDGSCFMQDDPDDMFARAHSTLAVDNTGTVAGEVRYFLRVADAIMILEYPDVIAESKAHPRSAAGVLQVQDSSIEFLWDFEEGIHSIDIELNHLSVSKSELECRTDPTLSFSSAVSLKYRAFLDTLRGVKTGHAYELQVDVPPLRCVLTPLSSPLLHELYIYMFYSFYYPLTQYDGEPVIDKTAPAESNFMALSVHVKSPRILITGNVSRKGWYFFEASMEEFSLVSKLDRHLDTQQRQLPGVREVYMSRVNKLCIQHPGYV
jgi:hypothetical protein